MSGIVYDYKRRIIVTHFSELAELLWDIQALLIHLLYDTSLKKQKFKNLQSCIKTTLTTLANLITLVTDPNIITLITLITLVNLMYT